MEHGVAFRTCSASSRTRRNPQSRSRTTSRFTCLQPAHIVVRMRDTAGGCNSQAQRDGLLGVRNIGSLQLARPTHRCTVILPPAAPAKPATAAAATAASSALPMWDRAGAQGGGKRQRGRSYRWRI